MKRVHLDAIDRNGFDVEPRGPFVLVKAKKQTHQWRREDLHMRSLLCRPNGEVVSSGFPKFFNHGENAEHDAEAAPLIPGATFTTKLDGSLVIRTVIDGAVHLRTRGNHDLGDFHDRVMTLVRDRYPQILNPAVLPSGSYLFEYTAPDNRIVLAYTEAALTLLGFVSLQTLDVFGASWLEARDFGVNLVPKHSVTGASVEDVAAVASCLVGEEGVVAWCSRPNGDILTKFKSAWYLKAHALVSFSTPDRVRDYAYVNGCFTPEDVIRCLMRDGISYEHARNTSDVYLGLLGGQHARRAEIARATVDLADVLSLPDRKSKALALKDRAPPGLFGMLIAWATGAETQAREAGDAYVLGVTTTQLREIAKAKRTLVLDLDAGRGD